MAEVDGLECRRVAQLGCPETPLEPALLAGRPLGFDEQAEPLVEAECGGLVGPDLLAPSVGHRSELHGVELIEGLFDQHQSSSLVAAA